jgi:hypothetical protein
MNFQPRSNQTCSRHRRERNAHKVFVEKPERKDKLYDVSVRGKIILKYILKEQAERLQTAII